MFGSSKPRMRICKTLSTLTSVSARQELVPGWDQDRFSCAVVFVVGAGGLGGEVGEGLVRKGVGVVHICDPDIVTPSNLNRQKFVKRSLWRKKARELCRLLSMQGFLETGLFSYDCAVQDVDVAAIGPDVIVVGVDNRDPTTREYICRLAYELGIPVVFMAVSTDADLAYAFVQEPGKACWACPFKPEYDLPGERDHLSRCPNVPAVCDILKTIAGQALYAVDSLIMSRPRDWNYRVVSLSSGLGGSHLVSPRADCPVCGVDGALNSTVRSVIGQSSSLSEKIQSSAGLS